MGLVDISKHAVPIECQGLLHAVAECREGHGLRCHKYAIAGAMSLENEVAFGYGASLGLEIGMPRKDGTEKEQGDQSRIRDDMDSEVDEVEVSEKENEEVHYDEILLFRKLMPQILN